MNPERLLTWMFGRCERYWQSNLLPILLYNLRRGERIFGKSDRKIKAFCATVLLAAFLLSACQPQSSSFSSGAFAQAANPTVPTQVAQSAPAGISATPLPTRPAYSPGELVDYIAQTGDTLPILAIHFNTTVKEILKANSFIPSTATTMPPGMPMKIPIYYKPLWGTPYKIMPDSLFIDGPAQVGFDTVKFVAGQPGWLKDYKEFASDTTRSGAQIVDFVALRFSVSPRLLLALLEYQSGALSKTFPTDSDTTYPMGYRAYDHQGLYLQLTWAANLLNNGYYGWRTGHLTSIDYPDGREMVFDPWQNAATVSLHNFFNTLLPKDLYDKAVSPEGFARTYALLFGDPWATDKPHIPGSLEQPAFTLPFHAGELWAFTGGPHTGWGSGEPYAALDFAPPAVLGGCIPTPLWATAIASGKVVRSETGIVALDLDGDSDERTGWVVFYLHVATEGRAQVGTVLKVGDLVGHPSCEGGTATGTHIHVARKYNGEWIPAEGTLPFDLEGWVAHNGSAPYLGTLTKLNQTVTACTCSNQKSFIQASGH
jgi:LasA protease